MALLEGSHAFDEHEKGFLDVDMCAGPLHIHSLCKLSPIWTLSGNRGYCNLAEAKQRVQICASPMLVYAMQQFSSMAELTAFRDDFAAHLAAVNRKMHPYASEKERCTRPETVLTGKSLLGAFDLIAVLQAMGISEVGHNPDQPLYF